MRPPEAVEFAAVAAGEEPEVKVSLSVRPKIGERRLSAAVTWPPDQVAPPELPTEVNAVVRGGVPDRLAALGLAPAAFDFVLVTEEHGAMKPAPRMVAATLAGMDLPGAALAMIGDRAFADQRFAEAAGMRFLGVRPRGRPDARWMPWPDVQARLLAWTGA